MAREILSMFEFSRNKTKAFSVDSHFDECPLWQQRSVYHIAANLLMHSYVQSQGFR